jgi:hypothetical protein
MITAEYDREGAIAHRRFDGIRNDATRGKDWLHVLGVTWTPRTVVCGRGNVYVAEIVYRVAKFLQVRSYAGSTHDLRAKSGAASAGTELEWNSYERYCLRVALATKKNKRHYLWRSSLFSLWLQDCPVFR